MSGPDCDTCGEHCLECRCKENKKKGLIVREPKILIYDRDPTQDDCTANPHVIWVSREYVPYRIFRGEYGHWQFIGKFYPV